MPSLFGEHMVLQRDKPILVWGTTKPNASVFVSLDQAKTSVQADASGMWKATLPAMQAGGPFKMTVGSAADNPIITWNDILIGEVWLCSGQSNMEWTVARSANPEAEIAAANHPQIRLIKVPRNQSNVPLDDFEGSWQVCSPETAGNFTAVGYYFGRTLQKKLDVPIGLINSSWGGTRVEPWTPPVGFKAVPALNELSNQVNLWDPKSPARKKLIGEHIKKTEAWLEQANQAIEKQEMVEPSPTFPAQLIPPSSHQSPTKLYNAMIHPLVGIPMRGAIWYQGESNHNEGMMYFEKKKALIGGWRQLWGQGEFPFYFVQIAPFQYGNEDSEILAKFWEAQTRVTQEVPNTGMAVISDIGNIKDIHPRNKQDVGARLAFFALKNDYGKDVVAGGPVFDTMQVNGNKMTLTFTNIGEGLKSRDGKALSHFEIAGASSGWQPATATIDGANVILTSEKVAEPMAMRFAWNKLAEPNLVNSAGIPASAFRAGETPSPLSLIPGFGEYKLVYDFDFSKLGMKVEYQTDNHLDFPSFERVAYSLEYVEGSESKYVFTSMDSYSKDAAKIGLPTADSKASFQQPVRAMDIYSNVASLKTGTGLTGSIEFWPNNYAPNNFKKIAGASSQKYDFGDQKAEPVAGYGSMQVHHPAAKQTVFAINHWSVGSEMDLGIGNAPSGHPDWTFSKNFNQRQSPRLRVWVK
ncbi:MAG: sialate O-acetylesterase [Planctomycetota bacterium]